MSALAALESENLARAIEESLKMQDMATTKATTTTAAAAATTTTNNNNDDDNNSDNNDSSGNNGAYDDDNDTNGEVKTNNESDGNGDNVEKEEEEEEDSNHSDQSDDDSDNEINSDYSSDEDDGEDATGGFVYVSDGDGSDERFSKLSKEINQVQRFFGTDSCYLLPLDSVKSKFVDHYLVYLSFPINKVLNGKLNLSGAWGFSATEAIQVRFRAHYYDWDTHDLSRGVTDMDIEIYQGEQPPVFKTTAKNIGSSDSSSSSSGGSVQKGKDKGTQKKQPLKTTTAGSNNGGGGGPVRFRLREQIKRIIEAFIVANWHGRGKRNDELITLQSNDEDTGTKPKTLRQKSSVSCPYCTLINSAISDYCSCCGLDLWEVSVSIFLLEMIFC